MQAFVAKTDKQVYANIKYVKQMTGFSTDEKALQFMAGAAVQAIKSQLAEIDAMLAEEQKKTEEANEQANNQDSE